MIGLGSNRLTVCRRGGMSVTQAGRGGMEWLAGGRRPSWVSPYSAQATAALKAQFPTQWPTIRDYGFAHPEYVNTLNWAVLEDINVMYSLIPELGKTIILSNSGGAWIDTGYKPNINTRLTIDGIQANADSALFGVAPTFYCFDNTNAIYYGFDSQSGSINMVLRDIRRKIILDKTKVEIDGATKATISGATEFTADYNMALFARISAQGAVQKQGNHKIVSAYLDELGAGVKYFVPFQLGAAKSADQVYPSSKGAQAVGTKGMLDVITGLFHPNANSSGSFTISETPAS